MTSIHFPAPIMKILTTRVARSSYYVEVVVSLADPCEGNVIPHFMHPVLAAKPPRLWNITCLDLDSLPILDTSRKDELAWLTTHTSFMWSLRERRVAETSRQNTNVVHHDVRVGLKHSLFLLFMHFTGLQGDKARIFGICNPNGGGIQILIFVSALRLDLSNRTLVLDCAILPLYHDLMPKIRSFLQEITNKELMQIKVNGSEMRLWKEMLPAWVERCRKWEHRQSCESNGPEKIPLSVLDGEKAICSCGNGVFSNSENFGLARWNMAAKFSVRAAISPLFSASFVEKAFDWRRDAKQTPAKSMCRSCGRGKATEGGKALLKCSRCHLARYCSVQCQRSDWQEHKTNCSKPAS